VTEVKGHGRRVHRDRGLYLGSGRLKLSEDAGWIEWKEAAFRPGGSYIAGCKCLLSGAIIKIGEVWLADNTHPSAACLLNLCPICRFQRTEDTHIARLQFMRRMRRETTQDDAVSKAEFHDLKRLVGAETIAD
jgi:hypothetical protein